MKDRVDEIIHSVLFYAIFLYNFADTAKAVLFKLIKTS
jgi:hypothetical protein